MARGETLDRLILSVSKIEAHEGKIEAFNATSADLRAEQQRIATAVNRIEGQVALITKLKDEAFLAHEKSREEGRGKLISRGLRTVVATVALLVLSNFVTTYFQIKAEKSRQLFSSRSSLYNNLMTELGEIETDARKLQWEIADAEASQAPGASQPGLLGSQARIFIDRSLNVLQRLQGLVFPPEWKDTSTSEGIAVQQAWYEVYALMACLENGAARGSGATPVRSVRSAVEKALREGKLDKAASEKIFESAVDVAPCAKNFQPELFQTLRARTAESAWEHLENDPISALF